MLHPLVRFAWTAALLVIGLIPSGLFFAWVERNAALPHLPVWLGWPWIGPVAFPAIFAVGLFLAFGAIHSALAQPSVSRFVTRIIPEQAGRAFYICVTGVTLFLVMALWQHTGHVVWVAPIPWPNTISIIL